MSRGVVLPVLAVAALMAGGACYQDDTTPAGPLIRRPLAKVLLTDAPFPYDSVASVNVYVVRIEANALADTSGGGEWVLITEPKRTFDLLALQQGTTAFVGEGELPAGQYHAVKMTIDTSLSSIVWSNGSEARVNWQNWSGSDQMPLYALVEYPVNVSTEGAEIVIDFDLGRSFLYDFFGTQEFTLTPQLRAINSAAAGAIAGTVTASSIERDQPVRNANVTVCDGFVTQPPSEACAVATGRSDAAGHYKVAFLRAGTYAVKFEQPDSPWLDPAIVRNVQVTASATTTVSVSLPEAGSGGGGYVRISGPTAVGIGGTISLRAAVGDASGNPVPNPSVTWTSSDTAIARVTGVGDSASVTGRREGYVTITATSGGLSDEHALQVVGTPTTAPVATVTVTPASVSAAVGDSLGFLAVLRDSAGSQLNDRSVSWFTADSALIQVYPFNTSALVRPRAPGTAVLRATSEGKVGQATITVH
jgi:hypothetical protein